MHNDFESWGRYPRAHHTVVPIHWRNWNFSAPDAGGTVLPFGLGRSYGDCCLNDGQTLLSTRGLNRFISFDPASGLLRCESGVSLAEILDTFVPRGFFLPVTPGTKFVTLGGAIANDVHGKNHHAAGSFGHFVEGFELLRSTGDRLVCTPSQNQDLFRATIGGLGLTGLILWVELRLKRIPSRAIAVETTPFHGVDEFLSLSEASALSHEYLVAWVDCMAGDRGVFMRGNHTPQGANNGHSLSRIHRKSAAWKNVPMDLPSSVLNPFTIRLFNNAYYFAHSRPSSHLADYDPFFYPLDSVGNWNRIYGSKGFLQWQCVVPMQGGGDVIADILRRIAKAGQGSFLAVMKVMGDKPSLGLMSFARPGITLALDFPVGDGSVFHFWILSTLW